MILAEFLPPPRHNLNKGTHGVVFSASSAKQRVASEPRQGILRGGGGSEVPKGGELREETEKDYGNFRIAAWDCRPAEGPESHCQA